MQEPKLFKNLEVYASLAQIVLRNEIKQDKNIPLFILKRDTIELANQYLKQDSEFYSEEFNKFLKAKKVQFNRKFINRYNNKNNFIEIKYTRTIDDFFALVHCFQRAIDDNINPNEINKLLRYIICNTEELRSYEYLKNTNFRIDATRQMNNNAYDIYIMSQAAKHELDFYKSYKELGKIDLEHLNDELKNYYYEIKFLNERANIDAYGKSLIGSILSAYINQKLISKDITKKEYENLKNNIYKLSMSDICDILDIELNFDNGLYIPDNDIKKLDKNYKLEIGRYNE